MIAQEPYRVLPSINSLMIELPKSSLVPTSLPIQYRGSLGMFFLSHKFFYAKTLFAEKLCDLKLQHSTTSFACSNRNHIRTAFHPGLDNNHFHLVLLSTSGQFRVMPRTSSTELARTVRRDRQASSFSVPLPRVQSNLCLRTGGPS